MAIHILGKEIVRFINSPEFAALEASVEFAGQMFKTLNKQDQTRCLKLIRDYYQRLGEPEEWDDACDQLFQSLIRRTAGIFPVISTWDSHEQELFVEGINNYCFRQHLLDEFDDYS